MALEFTGLLLFVAVHLLPSLAPGLRQGLIARLGELPYRGLFALVSVVALVLAVAGKRNAALVVLWEPAAWAPWAAAALMLVACVLFAAMVLPTNLRRLTRHPMLWGITALSLAHLLANGDAASVMLFATFGLISLYGMWALNRRGALLSVNQVPVSRDLTVVIAGLILFLVLLFAHPYLFGVAVLV